MAKPKLTNFAQVLRLVNTLTEDEKATLRDFLRPEPAKRVATKKASKKAKATEATLPLVANEPADDTQNGGPICGACGHEEDYQDHFRPSPHYHPFESPSRAKGAGKKSRPREAHTLSVPSSEMPLVSAGSAAHAASASD